MMFHNIIFSDFQLIRAKKQGVHKTSNANVWCGKEYEAEQGTHKLHKNTILQFEILHYINTRLT